MQGQGGLPGQDAVRDQVRQILQSSFARMDLVSREEFDAQQAVLTRTRAKLDQLEQQMAALEAQLQQQD